MFANLILHFSIDNGGYYPVNNDFGFKPQNTGLGAGAGYHIQLGGFINTLLYGIIVILGITGVAQVCKKLQFLCQIIFQTFLMYFYTIFYLYIYFF